MHTRPLFVGLIDSRPIGECNYIHQSVCVLKV